MRVLLITILTLSVFCQDVNCQTHYVPASVLIPTLNASTVQILHNSTEKNITGWNNPRLNKTGSWNWNQTTPNGDLAVGKIGYMDHRLFNQVYMKTRRWFSARKKLVHYPHDLPGSYGRQETISAIRVYNKFYDGLDSTAEIVAGGVGKRFVTVRLTSKYGRGFRYLVQIYGH